MPSDNIHTSIQKMLNARQIKHDDERVKSMVMYSGGADSLALAKGVLEATNHQIILHHVVIKNREKRDQFQLSMLDDQINHLKNEVQNEKNNFKQFSYPSRC